MFIVLLLLVCLSFQTIQALDNSKSYSIFFDKSKKVYHAVPGINREAQAWGTYSKNISAGLWNYFDGHTHIGVENNADYLTQSFALGYLEGFSTCDDIKIFYPNFYSAVFGTEAPGKDTLKFLYDNYLWMEEMSTKNADSDEYWFAIKRTLEQLKGVYHGYVQGCTTNKPLQGVSKDFSSLLADNNGDLSNPTIEHFLMINAWGDLYQIAIKYFEPGMNSRYMSPKKKLSSKLNAEEREKLKLIERCSAIIKLLDDKSDVVFGHATWDTFESLGPRIIKHYNFGVPNQNDRKKVQEFDITFSSSPAVLSSIDDFFTFSGRANMGVIETTNSLYNIKLLDLVVPESVLSWARAYNSHQLSVDGKSWAETFSRYHSGTYTNQWMVLDYAYFTPGSVPSPGFFTVLEEVPGLIHTEDMTSKLISQGYWPSYNNPYFEDISEASGYARVCQLKSSECYDTCPRANIFRDNQAQIKDIDGVKWMLSYNEWETDAASLNDSANSIAARGDLEPNPDDRSPFGALDVKATSYLLSKVNPGEYPIIHARLGPTQQDQPVFCWSDVPDEKDYVHQGQPNCFDTPFIVIPAQE